MQVTFNRNPLQYGEIIEQPSKELVKNTIGLFRASMEDAIKFGGDLTREALQKIKLKNNRKYVVVDTKISMLMPQFIPAILGWHTDGVPRPQKDKPDIRLQEGAEGNIYHLIVTGEGCLTEFMNKPITLELPDEPTPDLYKTVDKQLEALPNIKDLVTTIPSCQVLTWDWWTIHRAVPATKHEWRFLIRVAETNTITPTKDLRDALRTQQQVYIPVHFGW